MSITCLFALVRGEKMMPGAKTIDLGEGLQHLPQHYVRYDHSVESIEDILAKITFSEDVLLFAGNDKNGTYIQVGIIGKENYKQDNINYPAKIVYGRKWRIDADTPSSEIIQTTMLAIKKLKEHEIRELYLWRNEACGITSAPLSCHQDINMLKKSAVKMRTSTRQSANLSFDNILHDVITSVRFLGRRLVVTNKYVIDNERTLVDFALKDCSAKAKNQDTLAEFKSYKTSLLLDEENITSLPYLLLDSVIQHSDRFVEETFAYEGFKRFSQAYSASWIAEQSLKNRPYKKHMTDLTFKHTFENINYNTDKTRKPALGNALLAFINKQKLAAYPELTGHLPSGYQRVKEQAAV